MPKILFKHFLVILHPWCPDEFVEKMQPNFFIVKMYAYITSTVERKVLKLRATSEIFKSCPKKTMTQWAKFCSIWSP
jgi:hypothetical protein